MIDETLADDPTYRAGVIVGRQQSITDVMELLLDPAAGEAAAKLRSVVEWCVQGLEEGQAEVQLVMASLRENEA